MTLKFLNIRVLMVLVLLAVVWVFGLGVTRAVNRPVNPDDWRNLGMEPPSLGRLPLPRGEERDHIISGLFNSSVNYPPDDCGKNLFDGLTFGPDDCAIQTSYSKNCLKRWGDEYERRYWARKTGIENVTLEEMKELLRAQGIMWGGVIGIADEVLKDLALGVISCAELP